mmetsp:Transcript_4784/g.10878  ORF Transcript_4784/g.10878 Transcript_4784/m.10878 type:complete len:98 (-) Transcript_4784:62-355(-)
MARQAARALLRSISPTQPPQSFCWHYAHNAARPNARRRNLRAAPASSRRQMVCATWRARPRSRAGSEAVLQGPRFGRQLHDKNKAGTTAKRLDNAQC